MRSLPAPAELSRCSGRERQGAGRARVFDFVIAAAIGTSLAGCAVGPNYHPPATPVPAHFAAVAENATVVRADHRLADTVAWWRTLHDRELDSLIGRAIAASPTLEIALNRVQQARAQEAVFFGLALPVAGAGEGGGIGTGTDLARGRASQTLVSAENGTNFSQVTNLVGFDAGWEIDLFGKYRRAIEAAQYDVEAAMAARDNVLISLVADVTRAYLDMRALQMQLAVLRKNVQVAHHYVDFVQERYNRGITNELDVTLAQREWAQLQSQVAPIVGDIAAAQNLIAALIGQYPESMIRELSRPGAMPAFPARIAAGLPIDLLRRRPDIIEAERRLASATALVGVATANLFPQVAVTASYGWQQGIGAAPGALSSIWSFGPAAAAPILDFGTLDALVEKADYRSRELLFNYKQTVLNAVRDVDTAAGGYAAQQIRLRHLREALTAAQRAVSLAQQRFDRGLIDSLNVIDAQRQLYLLQAQYVQAQGSEADEFVLFCRSLGGGWQNYKSIPPIPRPLPAIAAAARRLANPNAGP